LDIARNSANISVLAMTKFHYTHNDLQKWPIARSKFVALCSANFL